MRNLLKYLVIGYVVSHLIGCASTGDICRDKTREANKKTPFQSAEEVYSYFNACIAEESQPGWGWRLLGAAATVSQISANSNANNAPIKSVGTAGTKGFWGN